MPIQLVMWLTGFEVEKGMQNSVCLELQGSGKPVLPVNADVHQIEELLHQLMSESKPLRVTIEEM